MNPIDRFTLQTKLNKAAVLQRLDAAIETPGSPPVITGRRKPFVGQIRDAEFEARRLSVMRDPFLPQIRGKVFREGRFTTVEVNLSLTPIGVVFGGLLLAITVVQTLGAVGSIIASILGLLKDSISILNLIFGIGFWYGLLIVIWLWGYVQPANISMRILRKRLEAMDDEEEN